MQLDRNAAATSAADTKAGFVLTATVALVGFQVSQATGDKLTAGPITAASIVQYISHFTAIVAILAATGAVWPNLKPPSIGPTSLLFFGTIGSRTFEEFKKDFTDPAFDHSADCMAQVHRTAEIARKKYRLLQVSSALLALSTVTWVCGRILLS